MNVTGKVIVVTGGASGIGKAMCHRFAREGAQAVVIADRDGPAARDTAQSVIQSAGTALAVEAKVSCLCPQGVRTAMLDRGADVNVGSTVLTREGLLEPEDVAEATIVGLAEERFLILPHPAVLTFFQRKAGDYDRWLGGMRRLQGRLMG